MPSSPWPSMLRHAAQHFSLRPADFWRLSLAEWRALTGALDAPFLPRADFEALAAAHPDKEPA